MTVSSNPWHLNLVANHHLARVAYYDRQLQRVRAKLNSIQTSAQAVDWLPVYEANREKHAIMAAYLSKLYLAIMNGEVQCQEQSTLTSTRREKSCSSTFEMTMEQSLFSILIPDEV